MPFEIKTPYSTKLSYDNTKIYYVTFRIDSVERKLSSFFVKHFFAVPKHKCYITLVNIISIINNG